MIHSQITVPLFGKVNADLLIDFTAGSAMGFVPFLQICQPMPLNISLNLKEELLKAQTPNITTYLGPLSTLWDSSTPSWKLGESHLRQTILKIFYKYNYFNKKFLFYKAIAFNNQYLQSQLHLVY